MPGRPARETEALHALAHPLRIRILEELRNPASAAEVARRLNESRQNLNYHLKELARGGFVRRTGQRRVGGFTEKLYEATTDSVVVTAEGAVGLLDCDDGVGVEAAELLPSGRWQGTVHSLHVAPAAGAPMQTLDEALVVVGRGFAGDRYYHGTGMFSDKPGTGRAVTLIELEALLAVRRDHGVELAPADARRNVVTRGVPLNHLVGREFRIGRVLLRGMRLCEPCGYLSRVLGRDVKTGLIHRGGLRADVVTGGRVQPGDTVRPC